MTIDSAQTFEAHQLVCKEVCVYSDRAQVKRSVKATLKEGTNEVVVKSLPRAIIPDSVRVDGRGAAVICEVQQEVKHIRLEDATGDSDKRINALQKEIDELQAKRVATDDELGVANKRAEVLRGVATQVANGAKSEHNQLLAFDTSADNLAALDKFLTYADEKMGDVAKLIRQLEKRIHDIDEELNVKRRNLQEIRRDQFGTQNHQASIILEAQKDGVEIELDISYAVNCANWRPTYDIRVFTDGDKRTMKVHYHALIEQNSGEDWTEAQLSLSTAMANIGGQIPELKTLRASFFNRAPPPPVMGTQYSFDTAQPSFTRMAPQAMGLFGAAAPPPPPMPPMDIATSMVTESVINTTFTIARPTTIPSDGASHKVNVVIIELSPVFEHEAVPYKSAHAFLTAKVMNSSNYPLLAGEASVFLDNNFVAKSHLKAVSPGEEFTSSLGVDPAVRIDYKPARKHYEESGLINKYTTISHTQLIDIKNTRSNETCKLRITEPIPLSSEEKMKVTLVKPQMREKAPFKLNKDNNLEWDLEIPAGKSQDIEIKYTIEHPKGEKIEFKEE